MKSRRRHSGNARTTEQRPVSNYDLRYVPANAAGIRGGGWYRELPNARIEVMARGQLRRVQLGDSKAEEKAKATVSEILEESHEQSH